jgi:hypothetical protein
MERVRHRVIGATVSLADKSSQGSTSDQLRPSCRDRNSTVGNTNPLAIISLSVRPGTTWERSEAVWSVLFGFGLLFVGCAFAMVIVANYSTASTGLHVQNWSVMKSRAQNARFKGKPRIQPSPAGPHRTPSAPLQYPRFSPRFRAGDSRP